MKASGLLVGRISSQGGFAVHIAWSALFGSVYGAAFGQSLRTVPKALGWGLVFGAIFWLAVPLILAPTIIGLPFDIAMGEGRLKIFLGFLQFGALFGLAYTFLRRYA